MAKKHAPDRKPYSPVDAALMRSFPTIFGSTGAAEPNHAEAVTVHEEAIVSAPPLSGQQEPPPAPGVPLSATGPAPSLASDAQARPKASSPERLTKYLKFQVSHTEQMDIVRIVHHFAGESDTPGKAGGLMSGAASKAVGPPTDMVANVSRPCGWT